jgi:hypothetical protein
VAVGLVALAAFVVVSRASEVTEVRLPGGGGITFGRGSAPEKLTLTEQRERSREVEEKIKAEVQEASPSHADDPGARPTSINLSGTWTSSDGSVRWLVSPENEFFVFRETRVSAPPDVITAAGYGEFDGGTWSIQFQDAYGVTGTASLMLRDNNTLAGDVVAYGQQYALALRRTAEASGVN